jgi:predicted small lipoprotein YifL
LGGAFPGAPKKMFGYSLRWSRKFWESRGLNRKRIFNAAMIATVLSSALLLEGCGRRGPPVPLDPEVAAKAENAAKDPSQIDPTANSQTPLPRGRDDNALKAGASKAPTPFDFLL